MNAGLVSVVIPSFNYGHFVVEAVESALKSNVPLH
jgi:glycosyltransferase involved in cell wall biosynthesis